MKLEIRISLAILCILIAAILSLAKVLDSNDAARTILVVFAWLIGVITTTHGNPPGGDNNGTQPPHPPPPVQ